MEVAELDGCPRMGPTFGAMYMSGLKAAQVALNALRRCAPGMAGLSELAVGRGGGCRPSGGRKAASPHTATHPHPCFVCRSQQEEEAAAEGAQEGKQMVAA